MQQALKLHSDSPCEAVTGIRVAIARPHAHRLQLTYLVTGEIDDLLLPPRTSPARADELWKHTCFEAFLRADGAAAYREFNFSPSTQWAAYSFTNYRDGMTNAETAPPEIETCTTRGTFTLEAAIEVSLPADVTYHLALSAVIEEGNGRKSYWALAHPPGKPDFHHPDCFALELPRVSAL